MNKFATKFLSYLIILFLYSFMEISQGQELPVSIDADKIIREEKKVIAEGKVVIKKGNKILIADKVIYYPDKDLAEFEGNVQLKTDNLFAEGKKGKWNFKKEEGEIFNVKGIIDNEYFFTSNKLTKKKDKFFFKNLKISRCPFDQYDWYISSSKGNLKENDYIHAYNATFRFCKIPVIFSPYFTYPINQRKSGFLIPSISSNSYNDVILKIPFFWVIDRSTDATITLDYRNRQGIGLEIENRHKFSRKDQLIWNFFYFREDKNGEWWTGRDISPKKDRWRLKVDTTFRYDKFKFFLNTDIPSDPYYFEDYGKLTQSLGANNYRYLSYTKSQLYSIYDTKNFLTELNFNYIYDLTKPNNRETLQRFPEIRFYIKRKALSEKYGIYWDFLSVNTNFYRKKGLSALRTDNILTLSHFTTFWKLSNVLEIEPRLTYYFNVEDSSGKTNISSFQKNRKLLHIKDSLKFVEYKNYTKFSHFIIPQLSFEYTSKVHQDNLPYFDKEDRIYSKKDIDISIFNILNFKNNNFLRWEIGSGYTLQNSYYIGDTKFDGNLKPLKNSIYLLIDGFAINHTTNYDFKKNQIASSYTSLTVPITSWLTYSLSHTYTNDNNHQLGNTFSGKVKSFNYSLSIFNNLNEGYTQQKRFSLIWDRKCWNLEFMYLEDFNRSTNKRFRSYYLVINILNMRYNLPFITKTETVR